MTGPNCLSKCPESREMDLGDVFGKLFSGHFFLWGASDLHTSQKLAATAASRGTSLLRFIYLLLSLFFSCTSEKIPANFLIGARSVDPAALKQIPENCSDRCKVKLIYGDFCPGRSPMFNFPLHRIAPVGSIL